MVTFFLWGKILLKLDQIFICLGQEQAGVCPPVPATEGHIKPNVQRTMQHHSNVIANLYANYPNNKDKKADPPPVIIRHLQQQIKSN
ncbi:MAG: hypothetical protein H6562_19895 [Lewinellaceae bacterium]|nr:hypothetical protein [Lewinella sp.]MCB9281160.1 hypothetical protein [Lewinellaceae bacterium]